MCNKYNVNLLHVCIFLNMRTNPDTMTKSYLDGVLSLKSKMVSLHMQLYIIVISHFYTTKKLSNAGVC